LQVKITKYLEINKNTEEEKIHKHDNKNSSIIFVVVLAGRKVNGVCDNKETYIKVKRISFDLGVTI
jgi:hypothetical protein